MPGMMLARGIADNFSNKREEALMQENVHLVAESAQSGEDRCTGLPTVATVDGKTFLANPLLHKEVLVLTHWWCVAPMQRKCWK